jgi:hypothetical protein
MTENKTTKENPFSVRPLHDRLRSANERRPTRPLPNLITHYEIKAEKYTRNFCISQCKRVYHNQHTLCEQFYKTETSFDPRLGSSSGLWCLVSVYVHTSLSRPDDGPTLGTKLVVIQ